MADGGTGGARRIRFSKRLRQRSLLLALLLAAGLFAAGVIGLIKVTGRDGGRERRATSVSALPSATTGRPRKARRFAGVRKPFREHTKELGNRRAAELVGLVDQAQNQLGRAEYCKSVITLGRVVHTLKKLSPRTQLGARDAALPRVRDLQYEILATTPARETACGIPKPQFTVDRQVRVRATLAPLPDGRKRPLARVVNARGHGVDFVSNELVLTTTSTAKLKAFLRRWNGKVLKSSDSKHGPPLYLVRIDPSRAETDALVKNVRKLDVASRGRHRFSSTAGRELFAALMQEAGRGTNVGLNWIAEPHGLLEHALTEGEPPGQASSNPFTWSYMKVGGEQDIGVAEAWRDLFLAGKLGNRIRLAVVDQGFREGQDYPPGASGINDAPGAVKSPWHGASVALTAGANLDNKIGTAGTAAPIIDLVMVGRASDDSWDTIHAIYEAIDANPKIINLSFGAGHPPLEQLTLSFYEEATRAAAEAGILVFASAGNDGVDVDAEDCFIVCWEEEWWTPCENDGVICVGGLSVESKYRAGGSNYGVESCGHAPCSVEIFGPFKVFSVDTGPSGSDAPTVVSGTSFASPFVAGVAALIWAARPSLPSFAVKSLLLNTAHPSPDAETYSYVNARAAVRQALGPVPPFVQINSPADGATLHSGGLDTLTLDATVVDVEDGDDCCSVVWRAHPGGTLGTGRIVHPSLTGKGKRKLTVTATDSSGRKTSKSVTITLSNTAPKVTISNPTSGTMLTRGSTYTFVGSAIDYDQGPADMPCDALRWTSSRPGDATYTGCTPTVTFSSVGLRKITLTATDPQGEKGSAKVVVRVNPLRPHTPPHPSILKPFSGQRINVNTSTTLQANLGPDADPPVTVKWTVTYNGTETTLGTTNPLTWTPPEGGLPATACGDKVVTLKVYVTDKDGMGTDTVNVAVGYTPC